MGKKSNSRPLINKPAQTGLGAAKSFQWSQLHRPKRSTPAKRKLAAPLRFKVGKSIRVVWDTANGLVTLEIGPKAQSIRAPIKHYGVKESLAVELQQNKRFSKKPYWITGKDTKDAIIAGLSSLHPVKPLKFTRFPEMYAARRLLLRQLPKRPIQTLAKIASENIGNWSELISHMAETGNARFFKRLGHYLKAPQKALDPLDIKIAKKVLEIIDTDKDKTNRGLASDVGSNAETVRKRRKDMGL